MASGRFFAGSGGLLRVLGVNHGFWGVLHGFWGFSVFWETGVPGGVKCVCIAAIFLQSAH
jgi:hypothetical protein